MELSVISGVSPYFTSSLAQLSFRILESGAGIPSSFLLNYFSSSAEPQQSALSL